jgi:hypothetical protein
LNSHPAPMKPGFAGFAIRFIPFNLGSQSGAPPTAIELVTVKKKVRPHPGPVSSQLRHQMDAQSLETALRNVVPQERETRRTLEKFVNSMAVAPTPPPFLPVTP